VYLFVDSEFLPPPSPRPYISMKHRGSFTHRIDAGTCDEEASFVIRPSVCVLDVVSHGA